MAFRQTFTSRRLLAVANPLLALPCLALIITSSFEFLQWRAQDTGNRDAGCADGTREDPDE